MWTRFINQNQELGTAALGCSWKKAGCAGCTPYFAKSETLPWIASRGNPQPAFCNAKAGMVMVIVVPVLAVLLISRRP
jgi:hypothetical protein